MSEIVELADRRPPVHYTVRLSHHWDGRIEVFVEDVANDERSRASVGAALAAAADAWGRMCSGNIDQGSDNFAREELERQEQKRQDDMAEDARWNYEPREPR